MRKGLGIFSAAVALILLSGCSQVAQVSVADACDQWFDAITDSVTLAGDLRVGESSDDIRERTAAWQVMVDAAASIAPALKDADALTAGKFQDFADTGRTSISIANDVAGGNAARLDEAEAGRAALLDAFYPLGDVCLYQ